MSKYTVDSYLAFETRRETVRLTAFYGGNTAPLPLDIYQERHSYREFLRTNNKLDVAMILSEEEEMDDAEEYRRLKIAASDSVRSNVEERKYEDESALEEVQAPISASGEGKEDGEVSTFTQAFLSLRGKGILPDTKHKVRLSFEAAECDNRIKNGTAASYVHPNQWHDVENLMDMFEAGKRLISVIKPPQIGASNVMSAMATLMTLSDRFGITETLLLCPMSDAKWLKQTITGAPGFLSDKIFHRPTFPKEAPTRNVLLMLDEYDVANKRGMILDCFINISRYLEDPELMKKNNVYILLISATGIREEKELPLWGDIHASYKMEVPETYFSLRDHQLSGHIKPSFRMDTMEAIEQWFGDLKPYNDTLTYRVHPVRGKAVQIPLFEAVCERHGYKLFVDTNVRGMSDDEVDDMFDKVTASKTQFVWFVINKMRRGIRWKHQALIGASHELYTKVPNHTCAIQGFGGRQSGHHRDIYGDEEHLYGPIRMCVEAIDLWEKGVNGLTSNYNSGSKKPTTFDPVSRGIGTAPASVPSKSITDWDYQGKGYRAFKEEDKARNFMKAVYPTVSFTKGRTKCSLVYSSNPKSIARYYSEVVELMPQNKTGRLVGSRKATTNLYPCYLDLAHMGKGVIYVVRLREEGTVDALLRTADRDYPDDAKELSRDAVPYIVTVDTKPSIDNERPSSDALKALKVRELVDYCRTYKIKGYSGITKAALLDLILTAQ